MPSTGSSHLSYTLSAFLLAGGVAGYVKTGSKVSLVASLGLAGMYFYGGHLINNQDPLSGHKVNLCAALLLTGSMVPRYFKTKKVWPAGIMSITGIMSALYEGRKVVEWQ